MDGSSSLLAYPLRLQLYARGLAPVHYAALYGVAAVSAQFWVTTKLGLEKKGRSGCASGCLARDALPLRWAADTCDETLACLTRCRA